MEFRNDPAWYQPALVDENGHHYALHEHRPGYVRFGDVAMRLGMQCQYASSYVEGSDGDYPNLGKGLRFAGDADNYHELCILPEDIEKFVGRMAAYQAAYHGRIVEQDGSERRPTEEEARQGAQYLADLGINIPEN